MSRRVVITGLGAITPLGSGVQTFWSRLVQGDSGISALSSDGFDTSDLACKIAGQVPPAFLESFPPDFLAATKDRKKMDKFIQLGIAAASEALHDSGIKDSIQDKTRIGVTMGSGIGGLPGIESASINLYTQGARRVSPFFVPSCLINMLSGHISIMHGLEGSNHAVVTACATGAHAIGDAFRFIQCGVADAMVAGGAEAALCRLGIAGFAAAKALSTRYNNAPTEASRPFDKDRDGFVMGEGAGAVVLETLDNATKRGATIYAEILGYGMSGDAYHMTAPLEDGRGAGRAMAMALQDAKLRAEAIGYINAHATSTPLGDKAELAAISAMLNGHEKDVRISSTKSSTGHLLGAAGAVESIVCILALRDQVVPPTLNLHTSDIETSLNLVPLEAQNHSFTIALNNAFGFGGTNASLVFKRWT